LNWDVFITCAVTGVGDTVARSERVPITPEQIADAALEAARAGAAIVHIHVRDPATGKGSRDPALYRDVVERIRSSDVDVVLNLTAGMGGDLVLGGLDAPLPPLDAGTDMAGAAERLAHVEALRPEICTIDCGTMNFAAGGDYVMVNTPAVIREMARLTRELGVRPELEVFDTGHLVLVHELIRDGLVDEPALIQLCTGIPYGAPDDPATVFSMVSRLPAGAVFSAFSIGRMQLRAAHRRERPRRARGQHLPLPRRPRRERRARRACSRDPGGDERPRPRPGRRARAARSSCLTLQRRSGCSAAV
jgi:uncharacterized protein (DUF849 family)